MIVNNIVCIFVLNLLSVVCVKGCASPIDISLVEEVVTTPIRAEVSVLVLFVHYVLIWLVRVLTHYLVRLRW